MRLQISRKVQLSLLTAIVLAPFAWEAIRRFPTFHAVQAAKHHMEDAVPAPPDGETIVAGADNFATAGAKSWNYYHVRSDWTDPDAVGGFGSSRNFSRKVDSRSSGHGLFLVAQPEIITKYAKGLGMQVSVVNQTGDLLAFSASDSCLSITQEAQDTDGTWKPIDGLPTRDCGNSYHRVFLSPNHFWAIAAPRYQGPVPTKLRFALLLSDGTCVYSNEFDGSINQEQFAFADPTTNSK